jgi:DNA-binding phage protein
MSLVQVSDTIHNLIQSDEELAIALLSEAIEALIMGEPEVCRLLLRDLVNATLGFESLALATKIPPKSLHRMLSAKGNPSMGNLSRIIQTLQSHLNIEIQIQSTTTEAELV